MSNYSMTLSQYGAKFKATQCVTTNTAVIIYKIIRYINHTDYFENQTKFICRLF